MLKRFKVPHVFALLTGVVFACSLLSWFVPSGHYERATRSVAGHERNVVVPDSYTTIPKHVSSSTLKNSPVEETCLGMGV